MSDKSIKESFSELQGVIEDLAEDLDGSAAEDLEEIALNLAMRLKDAELLLRRLAVESKKEKRSPKNFHNVRENAVFRINLMAEFAERYGLQDDLEVGRPA